MFSAGGKKPTGFFISDETANQLIILIKKNKYLPENQIFLKNFYIFLKNSLFFCRQFVYIMKAKKRTEPNGTERQANHLQKSNKKDILYLLPTCRCTRHVMRDDTNKIFIRLDIRRGVVASDLHTKNYERSEVK